MRKRPGAQRLTWHPDLQCPFESGWSLFQKIKVLNNLRDHELVQLIAREPVPLKSGCLRDCADSSWIDFDRFSELLEVPSWELKNGFWDQLGVAVKRLEVYGFRLCKICWEMHRYHCVLFDLIWVRQCPWHGGPVDFPKTVCGPTADSVLARGQPPETTFDELLSLAPMNLQTRHRLIGHMVEYLEWWRAVQARVPKADSLLHRLVSTGYMANPNDVVLRWQAGYAISQAQPLYRSWILENVRSTSCRYARLTDNTGLSDANTDRRSTIRDDTGHSYRAIRRHIFRRYVRRHRVCLARLAQLSRDDLLSPATDGICATCLAYVVWRMSVENLVVMDGLFIRRTKNYTLRLTEPWTDRPSDDPTRLSFTYMQFFGIWAAIIDCKNDNGLRILMRSTVSLPQVVFAKDSKPPAESRRLLHCIYPVGDALAVKAGRPCKSPRSLLSSEQQCVIRSQEWLESLTPPQKTVFEAYLENCPDGIKMLRQFWV